MERKCKKSEHSELNKEMCVKIMDSPVKSLLMVHQNKEQDIFVKPDYGW